MQAATGRPSVNLDSWAMPPALLDALVARGRAKADLLVIEGAMGLFDGMPAAPRRTGAAGRSRRPLRPAGAAGHRRLRPSRNRRRRSLRGFAAHDPDVRIAGVVLNRVGSERHRRLIARRDRAARHCRARRDPARRRRSRCPSAISAWCRRASMPTLPRGSSASPTWPSAISISTPSWRLAAPPRLSSTEPGAGAAAAGAAHRAGAGRGFQLRLSACARWLAAGRRRDRAVLAARRRGAAGRIATPAGCPAAIPSFTPARLAAADSFRAGLRASPRRGRCMASAAATWCSARAWRTPTASATRMAGLLGHATSFAKPQAASRLSPGAAARRRSARRRRARSCAATNSIMRR